jgi:hypothetical protein
MTEPTSSRDEILALACQAGLDLPVAYADELVSAYGHVCAMLARIPKTRARGDEPGHSFNPLAFLPPEG